MCWHNRRLDESFCWQCCFGISSEIDYDKIQIGDSGEIEILQRDDVVENQDSLKQSANRLTHKG